MSDCTPDERKLKTYVWHGDKCYFVSTIMRDSSAELCPGRCAETLTWEYDWQTRQCGDWVDQDGSGFADPFTQHMQIVEDFYRYGKRKTDD